MENLAIGIARKESLPKMMHALWPFVVVIFDNSQQSNVRLKVLSRAWKFKPTDKIVMRSRN